jgi:hypothetical protein
MKYKVFHQPGPAEIHKDRAGSRMGEYFLNSMSSRRRDANTFSIQEEATQFPVAAATFGIGNKHSYSDPTFKTTAQVTQVGWPSVSCS